MDTSEIKKLGENAGAAIVELVQTFIQPKVGFYRWLKEFSSDAFKIVDSQQWLLRENPSVFQIYWEALNHHFPETCISEIPIERFNKTLRKINSVVQLRDHPEILNCLKELMTVHLRIWGIHFASIGINDEEHGIILDQLELQQATCRKYGFDVTDTLLYMGAVYEGLFAVTVDM